MKKKKLACVILHYNTIDDTEKCIDSILKFKNKYILNIVIVDNNSPNNSGETLKKKYKECDNIFCILNKENKGFSAGNNIGFKFAKYDLKSDFIILFNNDTYIISENFFEEIINSYNEKEWAVMGPKILLKDGTYNGINLRPITKERVVVDINYYKRMISLNKMHLYKIYSYLRHIKNKIKKNCNISTNVDKEYYNILIHGCCLIFSPKYISLFDGLDEKTFMYAEEELLLLKLKKNNLTNYYNPNITICHSEFSSTKTVEKADSTRFKRILDANEILLKEIEGEENE